VEVEVEEVAESSSSSSSSIELLQKKENHHCNNLLLLLRSRSSASLAPSPPRQTPLPRASPWSTPRPQTPRRHPTEGL